jgi:hypothetical protein
LPELPDGRIAAQRKIPPPMRDITQDSSSETGASYTVHAIASRQSSYSPVKVSGFGIAFAKESAG